MKILVVGNVGFDLMAPYLRANGIETVLADGTENALNANLADRVYCLDPEGWEPLAELALTEKVDAVISISGPDHRNLRDSGLKEFLTNEYAIPTLANPPAAAEIAIDKAKTKKWLQDHGFPVTEGQTAHDDQEARTVAGRFGLPIVIKSLRDSGGVGMKMINSPAELLSLTDISYPVLIEKFVAGSEFSVEVLNHNGTTLPLMPVYKGSTNQEGIHPMERVKLAPAPLDATDSARLRGLAKAIVAALDLQPTADVDIVWGDDGPQVLEINPRFGGVTALSMAASGIMSYWALVDMVTGHWGPARYAFRRAFAADLPIRPKAEEAAIKELLEYEGIFRIKLQKLKKTIGRVALVADEPYRLLEIAHLTTKARVCDEAALRELSDLLDLAIA